MTRQEHLEFCRLCEHRILDTQQGLTCKLTNKIADFEKECPSFNRDESVEDKALNDNEGVEKEELEVQLSNEQFEQLRLEQNLPFGILAGFIAAIMGAILWGIITVATEYQIGYMALAVGAGVGFAIRFAGKGIDQIFGYWGAGIALFGVLLGNLLSIIGFIANAEGLGYIETLVLIDYNYIPELMMETFSGIDLFFYGIAAYEGFKFAFRKITEKI